MMEDSLEEEHTLNGSLLFNKGRQRSTNHCHSIINLGTGSEVDEWDESQGRQPWKGARSHIFVVLLLLTTWNGAGNITCQELENLSACSLSFRSHCLGLQTATDGYSLATTGDMVCRC